MDGSNPTYAEECPGIMATPYSRDMIRNLGKVVSRAVYFLFRPFYSNTRLIKVYEIVWNNFFVWSPGVNKNENGENAGFIFSSTFEGFREAFSYSATRFSFVPSHLLSHCFANTPWCCSCYPPPEITADKHSGCLDSFGASSAAAAMASGLIALMLQAKYDFFFMFIYLIRIGVGNLRSPFHYVH